jgi:hypothetical protein
MSHFLNKHIGRLIGLQSSRPMSNKLTLSSLQHVTADINKQLNQNEVKTL